MASKSQRTTKSRKTKPLTSREKVGAHRARLRAQGMRPVTLWVQDIRSPKFAADARRQCLLANSSRYAAADQAWVDSMGGWEAD
jgi:hypothetical protein